MPELFGIRVSEYKTTLFFLDEHRGLEYDAPLAFGPLKVAIYKGHTFVGLLSEGWIKCTSWKYRVKFGKLEVVCQIEGV